MSTLRSVIISALLFVTYGAVFGVWLLIEPHGHSATVTFFLIGVALVGLDLIRQVFAARESRRQYYRALDNFDHTAQLNRELQTAHKELRAANEELAQANDRLTTLAGTDPITALPNQRNMSHLIDAEVERSRRTKRPFSLLFLDLDRFKNLNDRYGHLVGDDALREFSAVVQSTLRQIDTMGRWGGEEFVVLLPEADGPAAIRAGERVRAAVAEHVYRLSDDDMYLTCSVGVASFPDDGQDRMALVNMADHAMYVAKKLGRNQVRSTRDPAFASESDDAAPSDGTVGVQETWSTLAISEAVAHLLDETHRASPYTHALTVLSMKIAQAMGMSEDDARKVGIAAQLQNVGNVAIPDGILQKKSSLTDEEREIVQRHAAVGADIVAGVPALADLAPMIRAHHEWWNGQGYPSGLREEEIPLGARIIAVVDVYKALTTDRPHRKARHPRVAFDELRNRANSQFDPEVVEALQRALAPNPVIAERILVDEYSRDYRESHRKSSALAAPSRNFLHH